MKAHKTADGRWRVWLDLGSDPATGTRLRKKFEAKTKREAEAKAIVVRDRHARGENVIEKDRTVTQLLDEWMTTITHEGKTANTLKSYGGAIKNNLKPHLGAIEVPKLRARVIQKVFNDLSTRLKPSNVRLAKTVLVQALDMAIEQTEISINPAEKIRVPKSAKKAAGRSLTPDEVRKVRAVCAGHRYGLGIELALMGLRRGEISGLRWEDFNEQTGTLMICRQIQRIDKQWVPVPTKDNSDRMLTLGPKMTAALRQYRWAQAEERDLMEWKDSGYIFVSTQHGGVCPPKAIYEAFKDIITIAGIADARLHDCRHTAATKLLSEGEDIATVAEVLGHSSAIVTATTYAHALPHKVAGASQRLEDLYE